MNKDLQSDAQQLLEEMFLVFKYMDPRQKKIIERVSYLGDIIRVYAVLGVKIERYNEAAAEARGMLSVFEMLGRENIILINASENCDHYYAEALGEKICIHCRRKHQEINP